MYPTSNNCLRALPPSAVNTKMRDDKVKRSLKMQILSHSHLPSASIKCVFWERNPFLSKPSLSAECIRVSDTFYMIKYEYISGRFFMTKDCDELMSTVISWIKCIFLHISLLLDFKIFLRIPCKSYQRAILDLGYRAMFLVKSLD